MRIGYFLSSEEWGPRDLVELAGKQIGPKQDEFFRVYAEEVLPRVGSQSRAAA